MRRSAPDLETWLECSESLSKDDRDLLRLLRSLAAEAGQPDGAAAVRAYYRIQREIPALIGRKLRAERRAQHDNEVRATWQRQRAREDWLVLLVRIKAYEFGIRRFGRQSREEARQLALRDFKIDEEKRCVIWNKSDLNPVERRALDILNGTQRVAKKNFLERDAIKLANAVIAERSSPRGKRGPPAGSTMKLVRKGYNLKLPSVAEVIEAIWPIIEQLAGSKVSTSPRSTMIKAIASAVRSSADLSCPPDLAASVVRDLRRTSGSSTT